jgi:hypothetical protein
MILFSEFIFWLPSEMESQPEFSVPLHFLFVCLRQGLATG